MCEFSLPCDQKLDSRSDPMIYGTCFIFFFFFWWKEERFIREADKYENVLLLLTLQIGFLLNTTGLAVVSKVS